MQKVNMRIAAIHDLSGFGRTSLTVAIPILSSMGIQVCPLPTAILSTHTVEYTDFTLLDLTDEMPKILNHWEKLGLKFDAVYSGFMACPKQMDYVERCIENCLEVGGLAIVDPVLGDNGILDATMTVEMVERMRLLVTKASVITPNFTEAAFLLNEPCRTEISTELLKEWLVKLSELGPKTIVITSVPSSSFNENKRTSVVALQVENDGTKRFWKTDCPYIPAHYPGTGDTFTSVLSGCLLKGDSLPIAIDRAVQFVTLGIRATFGHNLPEREGILLERVLDSLNAPLNSTFELL